MSDHKNPDLLFAEQHQLSVAAGDKTATVRESYCDYRPGPCRAYCPVTGWEQEIVVTEVRFCEARCVEAEMLGYETQEEFYEEMRGYHERYKDFGPDSPCTVLYFVRADKVTEFRAEMDEFNKMSILPEED